MNGDKRTAIIVSISSDIGTALAQRWKTRGWDVYGTYRTLSPEVSRFREIGIELVDCRLLDIYSVEKACSRLRELCLTWDVLVMCSGTLEPTSGFADCYFDEWERSFRVNFISQMRILRRMLPFRCHDSQLGSCVLFFAGGGVNNAPVNSSAYTISKIALVKMCELLDAEIPDTRFVIVGPGWVKTKIHKEPQPKHVKFTPMNTVLDCCDWVIESSRQLVGGRNFSVVFDKWGTQELAEELVWHPHMYKLRRQGNDWYV